MLVRLLSPGLWENCGTPKPGFIPNVALEKLRRRPEQVADSGKTRLLGEPFQVAGDRIRSQPVHLSTSDSNALPTDLNENMRTSSLFCSSKVSGQESQPCLRIAVG